MELDSTEINKIEYALENLITKMEEDETVSIELYNSYVELLERMQLN